MLAICPETAFQFSKAALWKHVLECFEQNGLCHASFLKNFPKFPFFSKRTLAFQSVFCFDVYRTLWQGEGRLPMVGLWKAHNSG